MDRRTQVMWEQWQDKALDAILYLFVGLMVLMGLTMIPIALWAAYQVFRFSLALLTGQ